MQVAMKARGMITAQLTFCMHAQKGVARYEARYESIMSLVKCKPNLKLIHNKLHARKGCVATCG